jgi:HAD superfamily hydrolase (TIGR01509 family)
LGLLGSLDVVVTGSEVRGHKPCSEGYVIAMVSLQALPKESVIVEDTAEGIISARNTGAHVWEVESPAEVTWENLNRFLEEVIRV